MDDPDFSITVDELGRRLGKAGAAPVLLDVRREAAFRAADVMIAGARRMPPDALDAAALPPGPVVVYCVHGHEVSQGAAAALRAAGRDARYLAGGIEAWRAAGLQTCDKEGTS